MLRVNGDDSLTLILSLDNAHGTAPVTAALSHAGKLAVSAAAGSMQLWIAETRL